MLQIVIGINILISLLCLYVAWRVWKLRRALAIAANVVASFERNTYLTLHGAPQAIYNGQLGVRGLRERYQQLDRQLQQVQQALTVLTLLQRVLRFGVRQRTASRRSQTASGTAASEQQEAVNTKRRTRRSKRLRR
ncbi:MAG TPA: hypothetical protein V6C85_37960 [Allocoleopsis sp.]